MLTRLQQKIYGQFEIKSLNPKTSQVRTLSETQIQHLFSVSNNHLNFNINAYDAYRKIFYIKPFARVGHFPMIARATVVQVSNDDSKIELYNETEGDAKISQGARKMWVIQTIPEEVIETQSKKQKTMSSLSPLSVKNGCEYHLVEYEDYHRVTSSSDIFDMKEHCKESPDKYARNMDYCLFLDKYPRSKRELILLDSPACLTTKYVNSLQMFTKDQIHVPNLDKCFLEKARIECPQFEKMATFYHSSVYEFVLQLEETCNVTFDFVLDYCCSIMGNANMKPQADIDLIFRNQWFPKFNGVMWLTFSPRFKDSSLSSLLTSVPEFVFHKGQQHGYNMKLLKSGTYQGTSPMAFFYFVSVQTEHIY